MSKRNITLIVIGSLVSIFICGAIVVGAIFAFSLSGNEWFSQFNDTNSPIADLLTPESNDEIPSNEITDEIDINHKDLFAAFWQAREELQNRYVDQPINDEALAEGALQGLKDALEMENISTENVVLPESADSSNEIAKDARTPNEVMDAFAEFWHEWQLALYASQGKGITYEYLMQSALGGMVSSLGDQHTRYLDPDQLRNEQAELQGGYEGIGAWVDTSTEYLTIISPMEGSPAENAGLEPGDRVLAVDGEDMTGIDGNLVIRRIIGPAGTQVVLTIGRDGEAEPFDVSITRAHIVIPNVEYEMLENDIAYLQLQTFGAESADDLHEALENLLAENPKGLIVDVRNNGGGYLSAAVSITSEFISEGPILFEEYGDKSRDTWEAISGGLAIDIPLVILVNEGSASASEILAGAIQDTGRGVLVGTTTFGKGSVQTQAVLDNNQGALRITIARWLTPNENLIHEIGIEPDVYVELTDEDIENELDPQLDKAIEILLSP